MSRCSLLLPLLTTVNRCGLPTAAVPVPAFDGLAQAIQIIGQSLEGRCVSCSYGGLLCSITKVSGLVKAHEIFHRSRHRPDHLVARPNFRIQVQLLQPHYTSLALDLGVEATYQLFLIQDRQTEVAPFSSLCRLIALQNLNFDIGRNVFIKCVIF
jgi:hypothetical protein